MAKDYYDILGVSKSASQDEIKKAFRKLAHKYHPDKSGGDEARFKEMNEAYGTLSDPRKEHSMIASGKHSREGILAVDHLLVAGTSVSMVETGT